MPLDSRKATHIQALVLKTYVSRQKTVVFVYQSGNAFSYTAVSVIMRPIDVIDPEIPTETSAAPDKKMDTIMVAPITTNFTGVVYIADTSTATSGAVAAATKYELIEITPAGIVPTGTHYLCSLRRFR